MIPSNTTNKEFARYYIATAERSDIQNRFEELMEELESLKREVASFDKTEETLREQISFARELVTNINEQAVLSVKEARKNSKEWNLANFIVCEIENSYFEL
jgi:predicted  nucleic acid-binding Zn-ribbon protein